MVKRTAWKKDVRIESKARGVKRGLRYAYSSLYRYWTAQVTSVTGAVLGTFIGRTKTAVIAKALRVTKSVRV